jgi:phosphoenolpyruvate-protein kinase (PTS system EI component)
VAQRPPSAALSFGERRRPLSARALSGSSRGLVISRHRVAHGSIIAREYGIPAVVYVGCGTRRIRTGARLRVDGFHG